VSALQEHAEAWATSLPGAAFAILGRLDKIRPDLVAALESVRLQPARLLLVGFGLGAQIGFWLALETATPACAGLLAYGASQYQAPEPALLRRTVKIRLIGHKTGEPRNDNWLGNTVRSLVDLGINARATQLPEAGLTPSAIRLGASYLAELAASALEGVGHSEWQ
jgi:pimeloyl-ACP methyl ester carboxylesterase